MVKEYDVTLIGLGPVGSLAALLLNHYGLKVLAIDKEKKIYDLPRAVTISDQGLRIMQSLDLEKFAPSQSTIKNTKKTKLMINNPFFIMRE